MLVDYHCYVNEFPQSVFAKPISFLQQTIKISDCTNTFGERLHSHATYIGHDIPIYLKREKLHPIICATALGSFRFSPSFLVKPQHRRRIGSIIRPRSCITKYLASPVVVGRRPTECVQRPLVSDGLSI